MIVFIAYTTFGSVHSRKQISPLLHPGREGVMAVYRRRTLVSAGQIPVY